MHALGMREEAGVAMQACEKTCSTKYTWGSPHDKTDPPKMTSWLKHIPVTADMGPERTFDPPSSYAPA